MSLVSIVFVTFNRGERLKDSLNDIVLQSFKDFELIICDDQSTDDTEKICNSFLQTDHRIVYYRQPKNLGMPGNINTGFQLAKYPYIAILHDGDRFQPDLIENWYRGLSSSPNIGLAFNTRSIIDAKGVVRPLSHPFKEGRISGKYLLERYYFRTWAFGSIIYGMAMFRKEMLEKYGLFKYEFGFYADVDFWMQILQDYDAWYCEKKSLIICPDKSLLPSVFDNRLTKTFFILYKMFRKHRLIAFKKRPLKLVYEMVIFKYYTLKKFVGIQYSLAKHTNYQGFKENLEPALKERSSLIFFIPSWYLFSLYFYLKNQFRSERIKSRF